MKHNTFINVQEKIVESLEKDIIEATIKVNNLIENRTKASINLNSNKNKNQSYNLIKNCFNKAIDEANENLNYIIDKYKTANTRLQELKIEIEKETANANN